VKKNGNDNVEKWCIAEDRQLYFPEITALKSFETGSQRINFFVERSTKSFAYLAESPLGM
jgi:hypothetical protein